MSDTKMEVVIEDDAVYAYVPRPELGQYVSERHLIITKEVFKQCYDKWIKESKDE